jgi:Zn-dependent peptidase ImmA (M78 family)
MTKTSFGPERITPASTDATPEDEAANDFAAKLLMPEGPFRAYNAVLRSDITALAQAFGVPEDAVRRRMAMLRIPGHGLEDSSRWEIKH